jgi:hypothetical protein
VNLQLVGSSGASWPPLWWRRPTSVTTFTIDRLSYSPSPLTVLAAVDFDGGGRLAA